jgi:uncharacterized protein (UPF0335 family)
MSDLSEEIKTALQTTLKEYVNSRQEIEEAKAHIKELLGAAADASGLDKKHLRKIANLYYRQNLAENETEFSEIRELYQKIFGQ